MAWQEDPSRAGGILWGLSFVPRTQVIDKLLRIGIPSIGVDESNVHESTLAILQDVDVQYDRHVLKEMAPYTSVALPRALTNGSTRISC